MEDTLLHVFVVVVSLLLSKDPNVFHDQEDDIMVSMQDHEHFLLEEGAKLEQGEHHVAMELPHSNQEESPSHRRVPREEGDTSDVQQITPNVKTTVRHEEQMSPVGEQNDFRQKAFAPDDQEILDFDTDKQTLHMSKEGLTHEHVNVDQNASQGDAAQPEKPQAAWTDTQADQGLLINKKIPTSKQRLTTITQGKQESDQEETYSWYIWKTLSLISFFRFLKFLRERSKPQKKTLRCLNVSQVSDLDYKTLASFHNQCVLVPPNHSWQTCEFVEGFVNDLLEAVKTTGSDMEMKDFVGVGSLYEQWSSRKSIVCDVHVPIIPPKPYSFEFELTKESSCSSTVQYCCKVKMVKGGTSSTACPCSNSNPDDDDDTLCLLHPDKKDDHVTENDINDLLCQENSTYLSKTQVLKWFKSAIRKAWDEISHKYEFELIFRSRENPQSLKVRFRSGRVILFNLTPVVKFRDSDVHLIPCSPSAMFSDTHWPVCFTRYESTLLQHITKTLPDNACHIHCLQILSFLHKHQTGLTGPCGLTSYHLKNALLHLLVNKPSSWDPEQMGCRLNDLLTFLEQKLKAKSLNHALVRNPLIPSEIGFPEEFRVGKPVNLFLPLLSNQELYLKTNRHLLEMIRNMPVLIYEYGSMRNEE
ncbi:hypothetical protein Q8A67_005049 [Cirrhinus molitorella]|uniref:Inositol 1,4,5-trisphosphate receptor-interacting protein n=1 Tax=Cirrhinus molitorella TaxID=172907 RepID=A0AA88TVF7_9TELE|nr:hypothetical protein Q8A67_005049 [Cirrhinus molitorella]